MYMYMYIDLLKCMFYATGPYTLLRQRCEVCILLLVLILQVDILYLYIDCADWIRQCNMKLILCCIMNNTIKGTYCQYPTMSTFRISVKYSSNTTSVGVSPDSRDSYYVHVVCLEFAFVYMYMSVYNTLNRLGEDMIAKLFNKR